MKRKRGALREEILNAPNVITMARIALIPFFVAMLGAESRRNSFWASLIFGLASATDFVDGYLARRLQLITSFGKFLDPLADKLITMAAYIELVYLARVPPWVVLIILAREFIISGLRTIAMSEGMVIPVSQGGKWKTALQLAGIVALIVHYPYPVDFIFFTTPPGHPLNFHAIGMWLTYMSLVPSIWSAIDYFRSFVHEVFEARSDREAGVESSTDEEAPPPQSPLSLSSSASEAVSS
jgi:CDP-diacylglycerol--glycerol-3-phosphate 3-phosphatidyltransferase